MNIIENIITIIKLHEIRQKLEAYDDLLAACEMAIDTKTYRNWQAVEKVLQAAIAKAKPQP